jgi:GPH family glycoside/pentoside/hexuronide:cation symporter
MTTKKAVVGWGLGSLGIAILYNTTGLLLLRFLVDYLGIAAGFAAGLIAISKIFDTVTDPIMGIITDRTKSRFGRRRPWLLLGSILCAVALPLLFFQPKLDGVWMTAWVLFGLLWYAAAYTVFSVPYMAMPAEMSDDPHERSAIFSWRVKALAVGQLVAGAAGPALIVYFGGGQPGHFSMSIVLGGLIFITMLASFWLTKEARSLPMTIVKNSDFRTQVKSLAQDTNLLWLLSAKMMHLIAVAFSSAATAFYTLRVLEVPDTYLGLIYGASTVAILLAAPLMTMLSKKIGKQDTYSLSVALYALTSLAWYFAQPGLPAPIFILIGFSLGVGGAGIMLMAQSLLSDVMADDRTRHGYSREGVYAGFYTMIEKCSYAFGVVLVGGLLQYFGYIEGGGLDIVQPEPALQAIRFSVSIAPAFFVIIAAVMMSRVRPGAHYAARILEAKP